MSNNPNNPSLPGGNEKRESKQTPGDQKKISRRSALKVAGAAAIGGVCASAAGPLQAATSKTKIAPNSVLLQELLKNATMRREFMESARGVAKTMVGDRQFAAKLLENVDSVQLINLYNEHRSELAQITGELDGRTQEGRYTKILVAAELFSGVSGVDRVFYRPGSEELVCQHAGVSALSDSSSSSSSSCSGCDVNDPAVLGCCIVHFWGWTSGGSCSPCND